MLSPVNLLDLRKEEWVCGLLSLDLVLVTTGNGKIERAKEGKDFLYPSLSILLVSKQERFVSADKNNCTCRVTRRSTSLTELSYSFCSKIIYLILIIYFFFLLCLTTNIYEPSVLQLKEVISLIR